MLKILPEWYGKVDKNIRSYIFKEANDQNIPWRFVTDSKTINECIDGIMNVLLRLKEGVRGEFDEETIKEYKKLEKKIKGKKSNKKTKAKKDKRKATTNAIRRKINKRS